MVITYFWQYPGNVHPPPKTVDYIFYKYNKFYGMNFNFNFILPKVNTDYMRQAQVLNIDKLRLIINLRKFNENVK